MTIPRTTVQFIEPTETPDDLRCPKATEVRINGIPVLVKKGSAGLTFGPENATEVTVTLLPTEVVIGPAAPYSAPESEPSAVIAALKHERDKLREPFAIQTERQVGRLQGLTFAIDALEGNEL